MKSSTVSASQLATATQYNDLRLDSTFSSYLSVTANTPVDGNVTLQGGQFQNSTGSVITVANTSVTGITFPTTATHKWYILISLDDSGTVVKTVGTSAVSPVKPAIPANNFPCGWLLLSQGGSTVAQTDITDAKVIGSSLEKLNKAGDTLAGRLEYTNLPSNSIVVTEPKNYLPIVNGGMTGSGSASSGWIGGLTSNGWAANVNGTGLLSLENGRLKLETLASGSFAEARNTGGGAYDVTAQSLAILPSTTYVIEFDYETQYISGDADYGFTLQVFTQQSHGVSAGVFNTIPITKITTTETHIRYEFTTSATANYCNILPVIDGNDGAATLQMKAWVDNLVVYKKGDINLRYITGGKGQLLGFNPVTGNIQSLLDPTDFYKYQIVPTVSGGNLTITLLNYAGQIPSVTAPVKVQIGGVIRTITSALSVTSIAGLNWLNMGSSELATKEVDLFTYLLFDSTNSVVRIGISRIPYGTIQTDFNTISQSNEKYISTSGTFSSTDKCINIGRFSAILSAGLGYTWSLGTGPTINQYCNETRWLEWFPTISNTTMTWTQSIVRAFYKIDGDNMFINMQDNFSNIGGTVEIGIGFKLPFTATQTPCSATLYINGIGIFNINSRIDPTNIQVLKETNFTAGDTGVIRLSGNTKI